MPADEHAIAAALATATRHPDLTTMSEDDLWQELRACLARRAENAVHGGSVVAELRLRLGTAGASFPRLQARAGIPTSTAHRWLNLHHVAHGDRR